MNQEEIMQILPHRAPMLLVELSGEMNFSSRAISRETLWFLG